MTVGIRIEGELDRWRLSGSEWRIKMVGYGLDRPCDDAGDDEKWQSEKYPA